MKIKSGATMQGMQLEMRKPIIYASQLMRAQGKTLTITCGTDGEHSPGSMHYYGYAFDFRSRELSIQEQEKVSRELQSYLGDMYQVLKEPTHIHVEMQPWAAALTKRERHNHVKYAKGPIN